MAAISTSLPSRRMPTRVHSCSTSERMCDDRNTVAPRSRASLMHVRNSFSMSGSRPLVGSSSRSTSGSVANAATRATFWRLPLE